MVLVAYKTFNSFAPHFLRMTKKIQTILVLGLFLAISSFAQDKNSYTLQQAIEYAYEHQASVLNAGVDEKIADAKVKEIVGDILMIAAILVFLGVIFLLPLGEKEE